MLKFLRSDLMQYFTGGFAIGAIALFAMQPQDARAEITEKLTETAAKVHTLA